MVRAISAASPAAAGADARPITDSGTIAPAMRRLVDGDRAMLMGRILQAPGGPGRPLFRASDPRCQADGRRAEARQLPRWIGQMASSSSASTSRPPALRVITKAQATYQSGQIGKLGGASAGLGWL